MGLVVMSLFANGEDISFMGSWVQSLGQEDPLEEGLAIHSSILAWKMPCTEEPGGLQSIGLQRAGHD